MNGRQLDILLIDDEEIVQETVSGYLKESGHSVHTAGDGESGLEAIAARDYDLALVDVRMPGVDGLTVLERAQALSPDLSVVIITGHGNMEMAIQALRLGASDFLKKPIMLLELDAVIQKAAKIRELKQDGTRLRETIKSIQQSEDQRSRAGNMVGNSNATESVRDQIHQAVEAEVETVLITGETGTGKEVVARELHFHHGTPDAPFIAVNCPALPAELVESELFGHTKGAFTGATSNRAGYFEMADGGTIFLDEIADLSASAQAKMLRVLEDRKVRRIGSDREVDVNVRVVAATNVPMEELIAEKRFRQDLYYRLNLFTIHLTPLRERPADILPLAEHFIGLYAKRRGISPPELTAEAAERLRDYDYPGNARELRNIVERAAILSRGEPIAADLLKLDAARPVSTLSTNGASPGSGDTEKDRISAALEQTKWNRREAAKALDMPYSTLRYKMQRYGIS